MRNYSNMHWLTVAKRIYSIAQNGLTFSKDSFDLERYSELLNLSLGIINNITGIDATTLEFVFNRNNGYQTPKVAIRAVIIADAKILLVKESADNKWALPGGYAEIGMTPGESIKKEVKEESGLDVEPARILRLMSYNKHRAKLIPFDVYQVFIECSINGGHPTPGIETSAVDFFKIDHLPELSERRVTKQQIMDMYALHQKKDSLPVFD